ncbi:MAG: dUTP diphosphatase [Oscillospiraceae bacterium]|nr:dUTP diphosphatase [Oscillospiraceae bacterium]
MSQTLKFKKTDPRAVVPTRSTPGAAGYDMCACLEVPVTIYPGETVMIPTGIAMEIPLGVAGLIFPRSGMASKRGLAPANKVAVIDPDYRGEIFIALLNHGKVHQVIQPGDRIAQMLFIPYFAPELEEVEVLTDTQRGAGGFGSTGTGAVEQPKAEPAAVPAPAPVQEAPVVEEEADEEFEMPTLENFPVPPPQGPEDYRDDDERRADLAFELGMAFKEGNGVDRDLDLAIAYFKIAAELGHMLGMMAVGSYYYAKNDCYEAIKWISMAAELGNAEALFNMGVFYMEGMGCDQDMELSAKYFHRAARRRHPEAQYAYGDLLSQGWGVEQDHKRALKWFADAAENGHVEAMYRLGEIYEQGIGTEVNLEAAKKWYDAACSKGHRMAAQRLVMVQVMQQGEN